MTSRRILVTGASRGIGRALVKRLAAEGHRVGAIARTEPALRELALETGALCATADLARPDEAATVAEHLVDELGGLDVLIHNAATFFERPVVELASDDLRGLFEVNVVAPFALTRALLPALRKSSDARVVFIGSTAASQGYVNQSAYVASKHALLGLARALAIEEKPNGVHVHTVSPGAVDTELIRGTYLWERTRGQVMIAPDDVAEAVSFLLSRPARLDLPEFTIRRFQ